MARFTVILPSGSVLLKNKETGETLTLSAESGPLTLGELDMSLTLAPAPLKAVPADDAEMTRPREDESRVPAPEDWIKRLPPGFGPNDEEPFLSPADGEQAPKAHADRAFIRVLDAPMDALVLEDFERTLEAMVKQRNDLEGEIDFLKEIEADPIDIEDLQKALDRLDGDFAAVLKRKTAFEELPKKMGLV